MKKLLSTVFFFLVTFALSMHLASCNSCSGGSDIHFIPETPDSTMYVRLDAVEGDTIKATLLEDGTSLVFSYANARQANAVHGQLTVGDSLAIMADIKTRSLRSVINVSEMKGLWMIQGTAGDGMRLEPDGRAVSVGNKNLSLSRWKIKNGMLILSYLDAQTDDENNVHFNTIPDTSEIVSLTKDSLHINVNGTLYICVRQTELMTVETPDLKSKVFDFTASDVREAEEKAREEKEKALQGSN